MNFQTEIETLIRARYPILYIISSEEMRVQNLVMEIAKKRQKKTFEWSYSTGIVPAGTSIQSQKHRNAATKDPLMALDQVIEQVEPAIFIFKDFHPFLTKNNFAVTRKLKEIALHLKNSFKTIILISPLLEIPAELEKEITVLNYPLPTRDDLAALLDRIIAEVKQFKQVQIDLDDAGRERLLQAALGLTLGEAENVFAKIIVKDERLSGRTSTRYLPRNSRSSVRVDCWNTMRARRASRASAAWPRSRIGWASGPSLSPRKRALLASLLPRGF